jgi:hypothetical protein
MDFSFENLGFLLLSVYSVLYFSQELFFLHFMKYRIIALLILIVLVGIPAFFYWFFTTKQVSSLYISASDGISFSAHLQ